MCSGNGASSIAIQILIGGLALLRRSVCPLVSVDTKIDGHRAMRYDCNDTIIPDHRWACRFQGLSQRTCELTHLWELSV